MIKMNYVVVGTNDIQAAVLFYDSLFAAEGLQKLVASERMTYWLGEDFAFSVAIPFDQAAATHGNGTMVGFNFGSVQKVEAIYAKALQLGATCEGMPAQRGPRFSAYVRDLDKNKLCFSD